MLLLYLNIYINIKISTISMKGGIAIKEAARLQHKAEKHVAVSRPDEIHQTLPQIRTVTPAAYVL